MSAQKLVEFNVVDGNLVVTPLPGAKDDIREAMGDYPESDAAIGEVFEHQLCNGWSWVAPEEIGALTSAPILSDDVERDDHGDVVRCGRVYYFADYALRSPLRDLMEKGRAVFVGHD